MEELLIAIYLEGFMHETEVITYEGYQKTVKVSLI